MNKDKLIKRVQKFIQENKNLNMEEWAWLDISKEELGTQQDYLILLDWQEGYDEDEHKTFVKDGYGLNVSIRVNHDMYFATDNPMPIINILGDILDGCTLSEADLIDNFESISKWVVNELEFAIEFDDMNIKGLDIDEQKELFKIKEGLNLHTGDTIEVYDYDDEDLMDFIEERGSNEFVVNDFSYYDGTVWAEGCEYGIDMQYVGKVVDK